MSTRIERALRAKLSSLNAIAYYKHHMDDIEQFSVNLTDEQILDAINDAVNVDDIIDRLSAMPENDSSSPPKTK